MYHLVRVHLSMHAARSKSFFCSAIAVCPKASGMHKRLLSSGARPVILREFGDIRADIRLV